MSNYSKHNKAAMCKDYFKVIGFQTTSLSSLISNLVDEIEFLSFRSWPFPQWFSLEHDNK